MFAGIIVFALAAKLFDEQAEEDVVDVGVDELRGRGVFERCCQCSVNAFRAVGRAETPGIFQHHVRSFARGMREEHANRDLGSSRVVRRVEAGKILLNGVAEVELALFVKLHDGGGGGHAFGERGHVEDGVFGHGFGGRGDAVIAGFVGYFAVAVGLMKDDLTGVSDDEDGTGELVGGYGFRDEGGGRGEVWECWSLCYPTHVAMRLRHEWATRVLCGWDTRILC